MNQTKPKKGRPTKYSQKLADEICDSIASTPKGIKKLCEENPQWPNKDTIFTWRKTNPAFSDQYAIAKQLQVECVVDELLDIADDSSKDQIIDTEGQIHFNKHKGSNKHKQKHKGSDLALCLLFIVLFYNSTNS